MNDANSDREFTPSAVELPRHAFVHLSLLAALYAFIAFVAMISIGNAGITGLMFGLPFALGTITATVVTVAIWSAFGERSYFVRYALSHLTGGMMVIALLVGLFAMNEFARGREMLTGSVLFLMVIPSISLAAQVPFLFLRFVFGWQLVYKQGQASRAFDLRDVFTFIFVFSLGIGAPQIALNTLQSLYAHDEFAHYFSDESVLIPYAVLSVLSFLLAIYCIPVMLSVFRTKTLQAGFGFSLLFTIAALLLLMVPISSMNMPDELTAFTAMLLPVMSLAIWVPLVAIKIAGFRLTSPKRESAALKKESASAGTLLGQKKTSDRVHPLDAEDETD